MSETLAHSYALLTPNSRKPTREQQLRYLHLRSEGLGHVRAARSAGTTGRRIQSLRRHDPEFQELYDTVVSEEFESARLERLRNEAEERAYDRDDPQSARILLALLEAHAPEMEYRRTRRVDQRTLHAHEHVIMLDPNTLSTEKLRELKAVLEDARALESPPNEHPVLELGSGEAA